MNSALCKLQGRAQESQKREMNQKKKMKINIETRRSTTLKQRVILVPSLCRGHANLLCIVPIFSYASPERAIVYEKDAMLQVKFILFIARAGCPAHFHL